MSADSHATDRSTGSGSNRTLPDKPGNEDHRDGHRSDILDEEIDNRKQLVVQLEGTAVREFVTDGFLVHLPADKDREQEGSERHQVIGAHFVTETEYPVSQNLHIRQRSERQ